MTFGRSTSDNSVSTGHDTEPHRAVHVDFGFLAAQTFEDRDLTRELLELFVEQARRLLPRMSDMTPREQGETAHRLKGSCLGIGAFGAAEVAQRYVDSALRDRAAMHVELSGAFAAAEAAILAHLASD